MIKADHAISGRLLKLANSALFAQRTPVTNLERACLLLGLERLKAVSLGFHLSRAASAGASRDVVRQVWGQSVFRACMAAEAARASAPSLVAEAFVIGLMLDAGVPLMCKLLGDDYVKVFSATPVPGALQRIEFEKLDFTHVDIVTVLARKWRFPELLAKPLELHHVRPADIARDDPIGRLHRIAYVVGSLRLDGQEASPSVMTAAQDGGILTAQRLLRLNDDEMTKVVSASINEYKVLIEVFAGIATAAPGVDDLGQRVENGLINAIDCAVEQSLAKENAAPPAKLVVRGQFIEIVRESDGTVVAFVSDAKGQRLVSHRVAPAKETPQTLCEALGIEAPGADDARNISERLRLLAA